MSIGLRARFALLAMVFLTVFSATRASAQVQIAVIGDSSVYGKGVSPSQNYPSQLEAALRARGLNLQVSNGGVNGRKEEKDLKRMETHRARPAR